MITIFNYYIIYVLIFGGDKWSFIYRYIGY